MKTTSIPKFNLMSMDGLIAAALALSLTMFAAPYVVAIVLILEW